MEKFGRDEKDKYIRPLLLAATGIATGILSGFFGGGGGMLVVPALSAILGISEKQSHATAIAVILPVTAVSAAVYLIRGVPLISGFSLTLAGVMLGGMLGALVLNKISNGFLTLIFYLVMIAAGVKMVL